VISATELFDERKPPCFRELASAVPALDGDGFITSTKEGALA